jgi:hypothetical protein
MMDKGSIKIAASQPLIQLAIPRHATAEGIRGPHPLAF